MKILAEIYHINDGYCARLFCVHLREGCQAYIGDVRGQYLQLDARGKDWKLTIDNANHRTFLFPDLIQKGD